MSADTSQPSLFPESQEAAIARLDSEIRDLLFGHSGGPLGLKLDQGEIAVLRAIRQSRGLANAVNLREIQRLSGLDVRSIKGIVRVLRMNFRLPIGSCKHATDGGYYLMITDADRAAWAKDVLDQVRAELGVLRAAAGHRAGLELLGQLHMEAVDAAHAEESHA